MGGVRGWDLGRLISPLDARDFATGNWGRRHLVVRRASPTYYVGLASVSDLDAVLTRSGARPPRVRLVRDGAPIEHERLVGPGALPVGANVESVVREFQSGATVALHFIQEELPALAGLCEALRRDLSCSAQVNVYLTPPHSRGLRPHPDNHDVFVLQLSGRKHWTLYTRDEAGKDQPWEDFSLDSGDLLYLPRGLVHDAATEDEASAHLTLGMSPLTLGDLLLLEVARVLESNTVFSERLPLGLATQEHERESLRTALSRSLTHLVDAVDLDSVVDDAVAQLARVQRLVPTGRLEAALASFANSDSTVEPGQVWRLRNGCHVRELDGGDVTLTHNGWQTNLPRSVAPLIHDLASGHGHRVTRDDAHANSDVSTVIDRLLADGIIERMARSSDATVPA